MDDHRVSFVPELPWLPWQRGICCPSYSFGRALHQAAPIDLGRYIELLTLFCPTCYAPLVRPSPSPHIGPIESAQPDMGKKKHKKHLPFSIADTTQPDVTSSFMNDGPFQGICPTSKVSVSRSWEQPCAILIRTPL